MSTVFNLKVLTNDRFISGTVRMLAITEVGPRSLLLHCWRGPVNTVAVVFMYPIIFYNFCIDLDCFSLTKHHIKIGKT